MKYITDTDYLESELNCKAQGCPEQVEDLYFERVEYEAWRNAMKKIWKENKHFTQW